MTKVRFWTIRKIKRANRPLRYEVRWTVEQTQFSRTFPIKAQAEAFRLELQTHARNGDSFDLSTGLPPTTNKLTCFQVAQTMLQDKWATSSAHSRSTEIDNIAYLLCLLIPQTRTAPEGLRLALRKSLGRSNPEITPTERSTLNWLERASLPITTIDIETVKKVLSKSSIKPDGSTYSLSVQRQRRVYLSGLFTYATENQYLKFNPVQRVKQKLYSSTLQISSIQLTDLQTAINVIEDIKEPSINTFLSTILFGGLRPSEASALEIKNCYLPKEGWGELKLTKSATRVAKSWTDTGHTRDNRGLKHRAPGTTRIVPIPPQLVEKLTKLVADKKEGRIFTNNKGESLSDSTINRHWKQSRINHGLPQGTLQRTYDLRHLTATTWIQAGLPITEIASRLGHSPQVCLRIYAHTIESQKDHYNEMISSTLNHVSS